MSYLRLDIDKRGERLLIDGDVISPPYCIDYRELAESVFSDGGYFILTCGCGVPGCAGLFEPIEVTYDEERIHWHIVEPEPERWYSFRKSEYREAIAEGLRNILKLLCSGNRRLQVGPYGFDRETFKKLNVLFEKVE